MALKKVTVLASSLDGKKIWQLPVESGVQWSTEREGSAGKLTFKTPWDHKWPKDIVEGSAIRLTANKDKLFFGWVFKKSEGPGEISWTCYDQLRYLKNKDSKSYTGKTAAQVIQMLADDYNLQVGELADTGYTIASQVEDNTSLFDMIENALDLTLTNTGNMYIMYDDFGKITLKALGDMVVKNPKTGKYLMIDANTGQDYDYTSSIDSNTYNQIKLTYDNDDTGKREVYIAKDSANQNKWGLLQYYDTLQKGENGQAKADALLKLYDHVERGLSIKKAFGDNRVRAGSLIIVKLSLNDVSLQNFMLVEKCTHYYEDGAHWMDLTLRGGDFSA